MNFVDTCLNHDPSKTAIIDDNGSITYGELKSRVLSINDYQPGEGDSIDLVVHMLQQLKNGLYITIKSSGTTGDPKELLFGDNWLYKAAFSSINHWNFKPDDILISVAKMHTSAGVLWNFTLPLFLGTTCILRKKIFSPAVAVELMREYKPKVFMSIPWMYETILKSKEDVSNLPVDICLIGGEDHDIELWHEWEAKTGTTMNSIYGTTEIMNNCITGDKPGTVGKPIKGSEGKIIDGVLWFKGPTIDDFMCTHDRMHLDNEGYFVFDGRSVPFVKVRGKWTET